MENQHQGSSWQMHCPAPISADGDRITLAHGEGGRLMRMLISKRIARPLANDILLKFDDASTLPVCKGRLAVSTDNFVVSPLFFPGGDIGSLAVYGTINDLAVSGARPLYLTLAFILEEGLPIEVLDWIVASAARAAAVTQVKIVAGDTKVVPRGAADGVFINTTGIGEFLEPAPPGPPALCEGDELLVSGPIGRHGIAVLCAREELALEPPPTSDSASLAAAARALQSQLGCRLLAMRDATRGGVAAVLHEWAAASGFTMAIDDNAVPVSPDVRGACELLGLDPLHVANEGTMVLAVKQGAADDALSALCEVSEAAHPARIGAVAPRRLSPVTIRRTLGAEIPLDDPLGAPLPRIC